MQYATTTDTCACTSVKTLANIDTDIHTMWYGVKIGMICFSYTVQPNIIEDPVMMHVVYPGVMVNFSCRAEGFSMISYSWFMVTSGSDTGMEIVNETNTTYIITDPTYILNATGYYCVAINNEGIAVSNTSALIGNCV